MAPAAVDTHPAALVALQAPAHRQRRVLPDLRHLLDRAVAFRAADRAEHVLPVVEVDVVGKVVHLDPGQGTSLLHGVLELPDLRALAGQERVAVHADGRRRYARMAAARGA